MSLTFEVNERFAESAQRWAEDRMTDLDDAIETKAEQALLEVEHLVSGSTEVEFDVDGRRITFYPSEELSEFLGRQAEGTDLDPGDVLKMHVDLFATAFLERDNGRPPDVPPPE